MADRTPLNIELTATRDVVAADAGMVHARLLVAPPAVRGRARRRPVALVIVLDRSGSMGEVAVAPDGGDHRAAPTKLAFVKDAAVRLVETMADGDVVGVVSFDDQPRLEVPMTVLGGGARAAVVRGLRRIASGGSTNLWDGIATGLAQLSPPLLATHGAKLLVLSDGLANAGPVVDGAAFVDRCATAAVGGVTVSTLGVGTQYDSRLLARMADAGNGDFHHIEAPDVLQEVFAEELAASATVAARGLRVTVRVPTGIAVAENLNGYPQEVVPDGAVIRVGDIARAKDLVLELTTSGVAGETAAVAVELEWTDAQGGAQTGGVGLHLAVADPADIASVPERAEVVHRVVDLLAAAARMLASALVDAGDIGGAAGSLRVARARMSGLDYTSAAAHADAMLADLSTMETEVTGGMLTSAEAKRRFDRGRNVNRRMP